MPQEIIDKMQSREKFAEPAIITLSAKHNLVEAVASLISEASKPVEDLDAYLQRFAPLFVSCDLPWVRATVGHRGSITGSALYSLPPGHIGRAGSEGYAPPPRVSKATKDLPLHIRYSAWFGIMQKREATGTALMLLGYAFRDGGLDFAKTTDALKSFLDSFLRSRKAFRRTEKVA
jgi:hypothetical protein